ncbi:MAG: hypothetical protein WDN04_23740 [Rhodospirillales bacterium]
MFERMHADRGGKHHVAQEDVPQSALGIGDPGLIPQAPSLISWPVMLGKPHMAIIVAATSAAVAGRAGAGPAGWPAALGGLCGRYRADP